MKDNIVAAIACLAVAAAGLYIISLCDDIRQLRDDVQADAELIAAYKQGIEEMRAISAEGTREIIEITSKEWRRP
jgi:hypothetical protein